MHMYVYTYLHAYEYACICICAPCTCRPWIAGAGREAWYPRPLMARPRSDWRAECLPCPSSESLVGLSMLAVSRRAGPGRGRLDHGSTIRSPLPRGAAAPQCPLNSFVAIHLSCSYSYKDCGRYAASGLAPGPGGIGVAP